MKGLVVFLNLLICAAVAQSKNDIRSMLPPVGDSQLILQRIDQYFPDESASGNAIWDLSDHSLIGDEIEIATRWSSDSTLSVTLPHIRYDFRLSLDTLCLVTRETAFVRLTDSIGSPELTLPLTPGRALSTATNISGRAYQSTPICYENTSTLECLGRGTLVLPNRRAYPDITLIRLTRISPSDTLTAYSWVSPLCGYPLARTTKSSAASAAVTWICDPTKQTPSAITETSFNIQDSIDDSTSHSESGDPGSSPFIVSVTDGQVSVSFRDAANLATTHDGERFTLILSDSQGRAFTSAAGVFSGGYATLSLSGVPRGEYLLYINASGITSIEKIITR